MIELGTKVRDILTGFEGVAVSRYDNLFNTSEIKIQPKGLDDAGKPKDAIWFEIGRVEPVIERSAIDRTPSREFFSRPTSHESDYQ